METIKHIRPAFSDARGEIFDIFEGKLGHVAMITSKKGSIRGNHYHKKDTQHMYLVSGAYESHCVDLKDANKRQVFQVKAGDIVSTPPYIAHAQKFTEDSVFLSLTTCERSDGKYEEDTIAYQVVEGYLNPELRKA